MGLHIGVYTQGWAYTGWAYSQGVGLYSGWVNTGWTYTQGWGLICRVGLYAEVGLYTGWAHVLMQGGLIISCKYVYIPFSVLERR